MLEQNKSCLLTWGTYSKKYMGLSRIMEESLIPGARFDLAVHPTYANSAVPTPRPWEHLTPDGYQRGEINVPEFTLCTLLAVSPRTS